MTIRVAELFAGVGGFRLALDGYDDESHGWHLPAAGSYETIWANQWEPPGTATKQFAADCYKLRFGEDSLVNEDIEKVLDQVEAGEMEIPEHDMVVGGFPCQDYSVARPLSQANGIEGKKGVLWWQIYRFLYLCSPKYALFENVDRLLKSPASQRGRDFAIMLACLNEQGYSVEWRVVNSADYGAPQRRRRVYIFAQKNAESWNLEERVLRNGVMASALPVVPAATKQNTLHIEGEPYEISENFGKGLKVSPFYKAGAMQNGEVYTAEVTADYHGPFETLGDVLVAVAGTPTSVVAVRDALVPYDSSKVHGARVTRAEFDEVAKRMWELPLAERMKVAGIQPKRAGIFPAGLVILGAVMDLANLDGFTVSESDILIGIVLDAARNAL